MAEQAGLQAAPTLSGQFVTLRPITPDDAQVTHAWRHGERARHLNASADTVEQQRAWIASRPPGEFNYIIELTDGRPIGMLSLINIDFAHRRAESARFLIGDEAAAQGKPAAVEAMKLLYELAFDRLGLERIYGTVEENNPLMVKWQKYLGMSEEGRLRGHYLRDGRFVDAIALGLLADDYRRVTLPRMKVLMSIGRPAATGA